MSSNKWRLRLDVHAAPFADPSRAPFGMNHGKTDFPIVAKQPVEVAAEEEAAKLSVKAAAEEEKASKVKKATTGEEEAARIKAVQEEEAATVKAAEEEAAWLEKAARVKVAVNEAVRIKAAAEEEAARVRVAEEEATRIEEATKVKTAEEEAARLKTTMEEAARIFEATVEEPVSPPVCIEEQEEAARVKCAEQEEAARIKKHLDLVETSSAKKRLLTKQRDQKWQQQKFANAAAPMGVKLRAAVEVTARIEEAVRVKAAEQEAARLASSISDPMFSNETNSLGTNKTHRTHQLTHTDWIDLNGLDWADVSDDEILNTRTKGIDKYVEEARVKAASVEEEAARIDDAVRVKAADGAVARRKVAEEEEAGRIEDVATVEAAIEEEAVMINAAVEDESVRLEEAARVKAASVEEEAARIKKHLDLVETSSAKKRLLKKQRDQKWQQQKFANAAAPMGVKLRAAVEVTARIEEAVRVKAAEQEAARLASSISDPMFSNETSSLGTNKTHRTHQLTHTDWIDLNGLDWADVGDDEILNTRTKGIDKYVEEARVKAASVEEEAARIDDAVRVKAADGAVARRKVAEEEEAGRIEDVATVEAAIEEEAVMVNADVEDESVRLEEAARVKCAEQEEAARIKKHLVETSSAKKRLLKKQRDQKWQQQKFANAAAPTCVKLRAAVEETVPEVRQPTAKAGKKTMAVVTEVVAATLAVKQSVEVVTRNQKYLMNGLVTNTNLESWNSMIW